MVSLNEDVKQSVGGITKYIFQKKKKTIFHSIFKREMLYFLLYQIHFQAFKTWNCERWIHE